MVCDNMFFTSYIPTCTAENSCPYLWVTKLFSGLFYLPAYLPLSKYEREWIYERGIRLSYLAFFVMTEPVGR